MALVALTEPATRAGSRPYWPLFGLRLRTPRLELRPVDDDLIGILAAVAREGIHAPGDSPFGNGWTERSDEEWERGFAQYFWAQRGSWSIDAWALPFAVLIDGEPVGVQQLTAVQFPIKREIGTGSWLSARVHRRGIGTEMREAVLRFGFEVLGAEHAITGAFPTALGSIGVSEKVGYLRNGVRRDVAGGKPVDSILFRLPRELWRSRPRTPVEVDGFDGCAPFFGL